MRESLFVWIHHSSDVPACRRDKKNYDLDTVGHQPLPGVCRQIAMGLCTLTTLVPNKSPYTR